MSMKHAAMVFIDIALHFCISLGRIEIVTLLSSTIHENGISFHLFESLISLCRGLCAFFVRLIPGYLVFLDAGVLF